MTKSKSEAAKNRISADPEIRRQRMIALVNKRWASQSPEQRRAHAMKMVKARVAKSLEQEQNVSLENV